MMMMVSLRLDDPDLSGYEQVVARGDGDVVIGGAPAVHTEVLLTSHRLVVRRPGGDHVTQLAAVVSVALSTFGRRLLVETREAPLTIAGPMVPLLFGNLSALCFDGSSTSPGDAPEELLGSRDVQLMRGPLAHPGELVLTSRRLHFAPNRKLDELAGARRFDLEMKAITHVALRGWPQRRLVIRTATDEHVFACSQPLDRFAELVPVLVRPEANDMEPDAEAGAVDPIVLAELAREWSIPLEWQADERIELAAPAVQWTSELAVRKGWLVLTTERVLFLPAEGPSGSEAPFAVRADAVVASPRDGDEEELRLSADGQQLRVLPTGGHRFVQRFLVRRTKTADEQATSVSTRNSVARVLGSSLTLRLLHAGHELLRLQHDHIIDLPAGLGIVFPGTPDSSFELGVTVTVEVGRSEGLYRFDTRVAGLEHVPEDHPEAFARGRVMLVVAHPVDIQFFNRRARYRARFCEDGVARPLVFAEERGWTVLPEPRRVHISDLSPIGCGLLLAEPMAKGAAVSLSIPLGGAIVDAHARVVRCDPSTHPDLPYHVGLTLFGTSEVVHDRIYKDVVRRQRETLVRRADARPC